MRSRFWAGRALATSLAPLVLVTVGQTFAETPLACRDKAVTLFNEAKGLMDAGDYAAACPKLEESVACDHQVGAELNLAMCYEHVGRTASACSQWRDAADAAARRQA